MLAQGFFLCYRRDPYYVTAGILSKSHPDRILQGLESFGDLRFHCSHLTHDSGVGVKATGIPDSGPASGPDAGPDSGPER